MGGPSSTLAQRRATSRCLPLGGRQRAALSRLSPRPIRSRACGETWPLTDCRTSRCARWRWAPRRGHVTLDVSGGVAVQYRTAGVKEIGSGRGAGGGRFAVQCVPLAEVLRELPAVDFLKIDVEGAEYEMLFSLDEASLGRVRRVCMEYHEGVTEWGHADLERFFRSKGWAVRVSPSPVRPELGFLYAQAPA